MNGSLILNAVRRRCCFLLWQPGDLIIDFKTDKWQTEHAAHLEDPVVLNMSGRTIPLADSHCFSFPIHLRLTLLHVVVQQRKFSLERNDQRLPTACVS